jgi:hypothetical protein
MFNLEMYNHGNLAMYDPIKIYILRVLNLRANLKRYIGNTKSIL